MQCIHRSDYVINCLISGPPDWTQSLVVIPELNQGFSDLSDGFAKISNNHLIRERSGITVTDAARWSSGMTEGKHVFEVYWPEANNRGHCSCIGVGSTDVLLKQKDRVSLVGQHSQTWGLDLTKRRTLNRDKMEKRLDAAIPERFYMYVDMDGGNIGFGADVAVYSRAAEFFGNILTNIPKNKSRPLHVMVSSCAPKEQMQVYYKGSATPFGGFDLCAAYTINISIQMSGAMNTMTAPNMMKCAPMSTAPPMYQQNTMYAPSPMNMGIMNTPPPMYQQQVAVNIEKVSERPSESPPPYTETIVTPGPADYMNPKSKEIFA
ncbi:unnamed protein product [Lymnaea stagnalis]|uniref:Uncharacterized protein n=1 Tax=Lymnaea stagnalis TaxID=6523 RepID=A0AAV2IMG6_LYMST